MGWKSRYPFLSKAGVSSSPSFSDCVETRPGIKLKKAIHPITGLERPLELQKVEATRISR
jgi:hypothetical protein